MNQRNPDLPILDELGVEFEAMVNPAEIDRHTTRRRLPAAPSRATRERGAQARRVGRRAAIVLVLVCLVGGVAFAALRGGDGPGGRAHTTPALLGRDAGGAWSFSVYRDGRRLCTVFVPRDGELSGDCGAAPGRGRLRAESAIVNGHRYVFGVTGAGVARVETSLGETSAPRPTSQRHMHLVRVPIDPDAAHNTDFPAGDAWFVVDLGPTHRPHPDGPAVVTPINKRNLRTGPPYVDCSLGILGPACRHRIAAAAGEN